MKDTESTRLFIQTSAAAIVLAAVRTWKPPHNALCDEEARRAARFLVQLHFSRAGVLFRRGARPTLTVAPPININLTIAHEKAMDAADSVLRWVKDVCGGPLQPS